MNTVQILQQMQKNHKQIQNDLEKLENLKLISSTEAGTEQDKKQFEKLLVKTKKTFSTLKTSYKLISKQKIAFPPEFIEIGMEINEFEERMKILGT